MLCEREKVQWVKIEGIEFEWPVRLSWTEASGGQGMTIICSLRCSAKDKAITSGLYSKVTETHEGGMAIYCILAASASCP